MKRRFHDEPPLCICAGLPGHRRMRAGSIGAGACDNHPGANEKRHTVTLCGALRVSVRGVSRIRTYDLIHVKDAR